LSFSARVRVGGNDKLDGSDGGDDLFAGGTGYDACYGVGASDKVYSESPTLASRDEATLLLTLIERVENIL
jgi:hypothetical protein